MDATELSFSTNETVNQLVFDPTLLDQVFLPRGGELALTKVDDRFSLSLAIGHRWTDGLKALEQAATPQSIKVRSICAGLVEIQSPPERLESLMQAARAAEAVAFASHVYQMEQSPGTLLYLTDQITLQFAEQVTAEQMHQITTAVGLRILKLIPTVSKAFVFQLTPAALLNPLKLANQLLQHPEILLAEPNVAVMRQPCYRPRESDYKQQWYLHHEGGEDLGNGSHIFAEGAWNLTRGSRSIAIAVVDDGIDLDHADFQTEGKIVAPLNLAPADLSTNLATALAANEPTSLPIPAPGQQHGTSSARLIAADETARGIIGVASGCALMPIRIGEFIDDQTVEQVCQWAIEQKADVIYCGWSAAAVYYPLSLRQRVALTQAATQGRDGRGCVIVFAAGNANRPIDGVVSEQGWANQLLQGPTHWLNGFAVHPDVISVAACTSLNQKSACSNWGTGISIAAPGGQVAPTLQTQLQGTVATAPIQPIPAGKSIHLDSSQGESTDSNTIGSTSAAAALAAGVAALVMSVNPDLTASEVRHILEQSADRIVDRQPDSQLGLCFGNYSDRYSTWFGYGKVNAVKALQLAQRQILPLPLPYRWIQYVCPRCEILDGNPQGTISAVQVTDASPIRDIEISVEIEHEFLGDLELRLIPPWKMAIPLQSRNIGRLTILKTIYSLENTPWLKTVLNRSAQGEWQLQIIDAIPGKGGSLQKWQLNLGV